MKTFLISCLVVGVLQVRGAPLSPEQKQLLETFHKDCLAESKVNELLVEKSRKGIYSDDESLKNYLYCFSQRVGFQDANGIVQKDIFQKKVSSLVEDEALLAKLVDQCTVQNASSQETAFNMAKCLRELAPNIELFKVTPEIVYLGNEKAQKLLVDHKECAAQDPLEDEIIENARRQGVLFEDPKFKTYILCFSKKQGLQRADGSIDKDVFYKSFEELIRDSAVVEKLAQKCIKEQNTPKETAYFLSKCIHENSPVHVELFPRELPVPNDEAKKIIEYGRACIRETGVDREVLAKTRQGVYTDDPVLKEFFFCMAKKSGVLNEAGDIQTDVLREKTSKLINDKAVVEKLIDLCAVKKDSAQETAFGFHVCFHKNAPGHLSVVQFGAVSEEQKEKRQQVIKECAQETGVSRSVVLSARKGDFQEDPLLKQYFYCINKKAGIVNEAGEYNGEQMRKGLTEIFDAEEAERLIGKCAKNLDTPVDTSFEGLKCFFNEVPEATLVF